MARVLLARAAARDLADLIRTHSLPDDTAARLRRSLTVLRDFPQIGVPLRGRFEGYRFLLGPWRWMVVVYRVDEGNDRVLVMRIYDVLTSSSPTHR